MESFGQGCLGYMREGAIWFYEGVKDFVGEDGMVIIQVVAGCMFHMDVKTLYGVQVCSFFSDDVAPALCC